MAADKTKDQKQDADKGKATAAPAPRRSGGLKIILVMTLAGALVPFGLPTLVLCLGLLPTLVALFTDRDPHHSTVTCVGFMNVAGILPFIVELWQKGQTMGAALGMLKEPYTWFIMLGAAAVGKGIMYAVPPAIAMLTQIKLELRVRTLREAHEQLKAIWGPEVASGTSLSDLRKRTEP